MSGTFIEFDFNRGDVEKALEHFLSHMADLDPVYKNMGEHLDQSTRYRYRLEQAPDGSPWAPLSPHTLKRKRGHKILQELGESGGLLGTLHYQIGADGLRYGTDRVYGAIHQEGGATGINLSVIIPARPYLGFTDDDHEAFGDIMSDFLEFKG